MSKITIKGEPSELNRLIKTLQSFVPIKIGQPLMPIHIVKRADPADLNREMTLEERVQTMNMEFVTTIEIHHQGYGEPLKKIILEQFNVTIR